ncbi:MAG TPA: Mbeg1-like protein [Wenzhouxiangellaceae bacterium]|nr:Mbeg1-like protein [Wenzhouxiangellaceae bacterium]
MLTVFECALLSEAAYAGNSLRPILSRGFRAYSRRGEGRGFFGRTFFRRSVVVVAFAGTDDLQDAWDDADFVRRIPEDQAGQAAEYFADIIGRIGSSETTFVVTGHSLGGGLAKHVLLQNDAASAAVAFNAPCVGGLESVNRSMGTLLNVNSRGDPVSGLTRAIGKFEIGETLVQEIQPFQRPRLRRIVAAGIGGAGAVAEEVFSQAERQAHQHSIASLRAALAAGELGRRTVP